MRIGYAAGGGLRGWLTQLGYPLSALHSAGLITEAGYDSYIRRIIIPMENNLYGRSIRSWPPPHRFLRGSKGGLYLWEQVRRYAEVILVEGLFDYAVVWLAGCCHHCGCTAVRSNRKIARAAYSALVASEAAALVYLLALLYR